MNYLGILLKRLFIFIFFSITLFVSYRHLTLGTETSVLLLIALIVIAVLGMIHAINPYVLKKISNGVLHFSTNFLIMIACLGLLMTGDLSNIVTQAEALLKGEKASLKFNEKASSDKSMDLTETSGEDAPSHLAPQEKEKKKKTPPKSDIDLSSLDPVVLLQKQQEKQAKLYKKLDTSLEKLDKVVDSGNIVYYYNSYLENEHESNQVFPYISSIGKPPDSMHMNIWLRFSYAGEKEINLKEITIETDQEHYELVASQPKIDRDENVWEWVDVSPNEAKITMLRDMAESKKVKIILQGKENDSERTMTKAERDALKEILAVYDLNKKAKST